MVTQARCFRAVWLFLMPTTLLVDRPASLVAPASFIERALGVSGVHDAVHADLIFSLLNVHVVSCERRRFASLAVWGSCRRAQQRGAAEASRKCDASCAVLNPGRRTGSRSETESRG